MIIQATLFFAAIFLSAPTLACTLCHSRVAQEVRARIFDTDFLLNLSMISLPVLILFGAVYFAARMTPSAESPR